MTKDGLLHRRQVLQLTGGLAMMSVAGCIGARPDGSQAISAPAAREPAHQDESAEDHQEDGLAPLEAHSDGDDHADPHDDEEEPHDDDHGDTPEGHTPGEDAHGHEDEGHLHDEEIADPVDHAEVQMVTTDTGFHFEPHVARVNVGGTVTFVNESGAHSATAYHPAYDKPLRMPEAAAPFDSSLLTEAGAEFEHTFETEGVYQYYCIPHEGVGMIAAIIVGEPDAHGQPGLEPPQASFTGRAAEKIESLNELCNEALGHTHD